MPIEMPGIDLQAIEGQIASGEWVVMPSSEAKKMLQIASGDYKCEALNPGNLHLDLKDAREALKLAKSAFADIAAHDAPCHRDGTCIYCGMPGIGELVWHERDNDYDEDEDAYIRRCESGNPGSHHHFPDCAWRKAHEFLQLEAVKEL